MTSLTTFSVNRAAGKKESSQTIRHRSNSPDVMTNMAACLGDAIAQTNEEYATISTSDLRMTIRRAKPTKPLVNPTTSTPFELLEIKGKSENAQDVVANLRTDRIHF